MTPSGQGLTTQRDFMHSDAKHIRHSLDQQRPVQTAHHIPLSTSTAIPGGPPADISATTSHTSILGEAMPVQEMFRAPRNAQRRQPSPTSAEGEAMFEPHRMTKDGFPVNNKLKKGKYATSIDDRGYLSVYEFQLNEQTIMWDYCTGLVHLTGIWKALGNSKADIVRLVDSHPELEGVIRRIRGGFLKIQGTWVPFELCKKLALRTCYTIRHALISVFGPDFPEQCLKPDARGYGTLTLDDSGIDNRRKKKRKIEVPEPQRPTRKLSERERRPRVQYQDTASIVSTDSSNSLREHFTPPPLPRVLDVSPNGTGFCPTKPELLDLLRASRRLQMISTGLETPELSFEALGGSFDLSGTTYYWDGQMTGPKGLQVLDDDPSYEVGDPYEDHQDVPEIAKGSSMSRKFSNTTTNASSEYGALTPPNSYTPVKVGFVQIPAASIGRGHWRSGGSVQPLPEEAVSVVAKPQIKTAGIDILSSW